MTETEEKELRINNRIRAREVRVIGAEGQQIGIMPVWDALRMAEEAGLDLVEIGPMASPPVCRIMDYGRFKYEKSKRAKEAKKHQFLAQLKEVKIRYKTDEHDLQTKLRQAREFLKEGHKVKFVMYFRGREIQFAGLGQQTMERIAAELMDVGVLERPPRMEARMLAMYLLSKGPVARKKPEEADAQDQDQ